MTNLEVFSAVASVLYSLLTVAGFVGMVASDDTGERGWACALFIVFGLLTVWGWHSI